MHCIFLLLCSAKQQSEKGVRHIKKFLCSFLTVLLLCAPILSACDDESISKSDSDTQQAASDSETGNSGDAAEIIPNVPAACNHVPVTDAAVPATCKSTGLTEGSHCSVCKKVLVKQNTVPVTNGHTFVYDPDGQHTHKCSVCSKKFLSYGKADGSLLESKYSVKYYVAESSKGNDKYEIVIFGNGAMPDNFSPDKRSPWYQYLQKTVKITIESGVTSIGKYCFYCSETMEALPICEFIMSDTVKTIQEYAIRLKIPKLTIGNGVTSIAPDGYNLDYIKIPRFVYVPKSVKSLGLGSATLSSASWVYEGSLEDFYKLKVRAWNETMTVRELIYYNGSEEFIDNIHIYVNAKNINDFGDQNYWR